MRNIFVSETAKLYRYNHCKMWANAQTRKCAEEGIQMKIGI